MKLHELLYIVAAVFAMAIAVLFWYKSMAFKKYVAKHKRALPKKWMGYYDWIEITDTSSMSRRRIMMRSNYLSNVLWGCIIIVLVIVGMIVKVLFL
jgi:hypothetical protein